MKAEMSWDVKCPYTRNGKDYDIMSISTYLRTEVR